MQQRPGEGRGLRWARALPEAASHFRGPGRVGLFGERGLFFLPEWELIWAPQAGREGFFLPPQRRLGGGGEGKGREGGKRGRRWRGARLCASRLGCGARPQSIPPDDAPAAGARERPQPGSTVLPSLSLDLSGSGREGAQGRGVGKREQSLRQPQAQRRWDPVTRAPPPRPGLGLGHAPSLGAASLLAVTASKSLLPLP